MVRPFLFCTGPETDSPSIPYPAVPVKGYAGEKQDGPCRTAVFYKFLNLHNNVFSRGMVYAILNTSMLKIVGQRNFPPVGFVHMMSYFAESDVYP